jgi:hypothetical protein
VPHKDVYAAKRARLKAIQEYEAAQAKAAAAAKPAAEQVQ